MSESINHTHDNLTFNYPLDFHGRETLNKLAFWSKFVGIVNILMGILYSLTIFIGSIPTVIIGVFYILIGTRLNSASAHLRYSLHHETSEGFISAIDKFRSSMLLNGILFIITIVIFAIILFLILVFGNIFKDIILEATGDFS